MGVGGTLQKKGRLLKSCQGSLVFTFPCSLGILRDLGQKRPILRLSISVLGRDTQAIAILNRSSDWLLWLGDQGRQAYSAATESCSLFVTQLSV